jgi:hypothetical protein
LSTILIAWLKRKLYQGFGHLCMQRCRLKQNRPWSPLNCPRKDARDAVFVSSYAPRDV